MDQFTRMKAFVDIIDCGGFSAAARKYGRSKALMSKYVRELEDEMGILLLNRTTRQFSLTEAGALYYQSALEIINRMSDLQELVRESGSGLKGRLRATAPRALIDMGFGLPLVEFCENNPDLTLEVNLEDKFIDMVEDGFDVAIRITRLKDSALIARKLSGFRLVLCATPQVLKTYGTPERPEDLAHLPCIIDGNLRHRSNWHFVDENGKDITVSVVGRYEVNSPEAVRQALLRNMGFALLPEFAVYRELANGKLVALMSDRLQSGFGIYAVYPHRRHVPAKVRTFVDFLTKWFKSRSHDFLGKDD